MKKSTNGIQCTETGGLSYKEISDIIKISGKFGVSKLQFGALTIEFFQKSAQSPEPNLPEPLNFKDFSEEPENSEHKAALEAFNEAETMLSDPSAHEDAMVEEAFKKVN